MKKAVPFIILLLVLVIFPLLNSGAFADFIGKSPIPVDFVLDPVNMLLFGIGLTFAGTRG